MKILHAVEFYHPSIGGMQEVVRQLSERLVQKGYDLTVATSQLSERTQKTHNGVHIAEFLISGNSVNGFDGDVQNYQEFVINGSFDVVTCFAAQQWTSDALFPVSEHIKAAKVFVPTGFSALYNPAYREYFEAMPHWLRCFDMNIFLSDCYRDINFARRHGITRRMLIPNGAAADEFLETRPDIRSSLGISPEHFLILHVGSHTGLKGHDRAMEIFQASDIRNAVLLLVGNESQGGCGFHCRQLATQLNNDVTMQTSGKKILVTSLSRSDTVAAYQAADLFLFPSLVECSPIVLFECMASRTPFLASNAGNSAEIIDWSGGAGLLLPAKRRSRLKHLLVTLRGKLATDEDSSVIDLDVAGSAELLTKLYKDRTKREAMAQAGFKAWQKRFTWESIALEYEALYQRLVAGKSQ